jgi:hypothetical protein
MELLTKQLFAISFKVHNGHVVIKCSTHCHGWVADGNV